MKKETTRIGGNLAALIEKHQTNPNALSEATGVPQPTIHRILTGESSDPRTSSVKPLADFFGVTVTALREQDLTKVAGNATLSGYELESASETSEPTFEIEYWNAKGSCGGGSMNWNVEVRGKLVKEESWFRKYDLKPKDAVVVYADGDSNSDYIVDGDMVVFNRSKTEPKTGKLFLIEHPDGLRIKQLRREIDGTWVLESRNPDKRRYPDERIPPSQASLLKVVGEYVYRQG